MSAISGFCEKCNKFRKRHCDGNRNTCMSILFDIIEALWQKIEQLKEQINTAKIGWDTYKTYSEQLEQQIVDLIAEVDTIEAMRKHIKALQQENKQLRAECDGAARMKNAIQYVLYHLRRGGKSWIIDKLEPALSTTPADYHNPADVEALRQARNLLQRYKDHIKSYPCECKFGLDFYGNKTPFRDGEMCERCAELAEIDKVLGGKEE